jgi:hypothetical protein
LLNRRWGEMRLVLLFATVVAALVVAGAAVAFDQTVIPYQPGNPLTNGCPSGWEALKLSDLAPYGYHVVSSGLDANGDGIICGKPLTPQEQAVRFPNAFVPVVFDFTDNSLTPGF